MAGKVPTPRHWGLAALRLSGLLRCVHRLHPAPLLAMRLISSLFATATAALLIPAAAHAGTLAYSGNTLVYTAAPGNSEFLHFDRDEADGSLTVSVNNAGLTI